MLSADAIEKILIKSFDSDACLVYKAIAPHQPVSVDELSVEPGDTLRLTKRAQDGWIEGHNGVCCGWFHCSVLDPQPLEVLTSKTTIEQLIAMRQTNMQLNELSFKAFSRDTKTKRLDILLQDTAAIIKTYQRHISSLYSWEFKYNRLLESVEAKWIQPIKEANWMSFSERMDLTLNFDLLREIHEQLTQELAESSEWQPSLSYLRVLALIEEEYGHYLSKLPLALQIAKKYSQHPEMIELLRKVSVDQQDIEQHLTKLISMPLTQMNYWLHVFEKLSLFDDHLDNQDYQSIYSRLLSLSNQVKLESQKMENSLMLFEVLSKSSKKNSKELAINGELLRYANVKLLTRKKNSKRLLLLFKNAMLVAKRTRDKVEIKNSINFSDSKFSLHSESDNELIFTQNGKVFKVSFDFWKDVNEWLVSIQELLESSKKKTLLSSKPSTFSLRGLFKRSSFATHEPEIEHPTFPMPVSLPQSPVMEIQKAPATLKRSKSEPRSLLKHEKNCESIDLKNLRQEMTRMMSEMNLLKHAMKINS